MKIKYLILAGILAVLASGTVKATDPSYGFGDLILTIRNLSGTQAYAVDLGTPSSFSSSFTVSVPGLSSDVTTATGNSNWETNANVYFSVFGADSGDDTWYATDPSTLSNSAWRSTPSSDTVDGGIAGFADGFTGEPSLNDNSEAVIETNTDDDSYKNFLGDGTGNSTAFDYFSPDVEAPVTGGAFPLYGITDTSSSVKGTLEGSFLVDGPENKIIFTAGAVPEPSTIAGVVMGAAALIAARRRRA